MRNSFKQSLFFTLSFLFCECALAAGIFDVVPTDKSLSYLGDIFGGSVGAITLSSSGGVNPLLSKMFERFNFIIVTVGVSILSYIGIAAAINTAREGEAMGKKFSLWVPLRSMTGMLLMVPSPGTGYSVVQMTVMWVVLNGIGAANVIWNVVLDQLSTAGIGITPITIPVNTSSLYSVWGGALKSAVCKNSLNNISGLAIRNTYGDIKYIPEVGPMTPTTPTGGQPIKQTVTVYVGVEGSPNDIYKNICGSLTTDTIIQANDPDNSYNSSSLSQRANIKLGALMAIFDAVDPAAQQLSVISQPGSAPPKVESSEYGNRAITGYQAAIAQLAGGIRAQNTQGSTWEQNANRPSVSDEINYLKKIGWIHAGGYYYFLTQSNVKIDSDALKIPTPTFPDVTTDTAITTNNVTQWGSPSNLFQALTNNTNRMILNSALLGGDNYWKSNLAPQPLSIPTFTSQWPGAGLGFLDSIGEGIANDVRKPILEKFKAASNIASNQDPLVSMAVFGYQIMMSSEAAVFGFLVLSFLIATPFAAMAACNPTAYSATMVAIEFFTIFFGFFAAIWICGATLGIYIPLAPYLIFTGTAIGWFIAVVEAIVGAPIIALAMVQPGGEELGPIKNGLMILANLFLRPALMIFGFIIASSLLRASINLVNYGFAQTLTVSIPKTTLFGIIPVLGIYCFFIMSLVNQSFSLIYVLPNKILRYIGGHEEQFTPSEMTGQAKEGFTKGGGIAEKGVGVPGAKAQTRLKEAAERGKKKREDAAAGGPD